MVWLSRKIYEPSAETRNILPYKCERHQLFMAGHSPPRCTILFDLNQLPKSVAYTHTSLLQSFWFPSQKWVSMSPPPLTRLSCQRMFIFDSVCHFLFSTGPWKICLPTPHSPLLLFEKETEREKTPAWLDLQQILEFNPGRPTRWLCKTCCVHLVEMIEPGLPKLQWIFYHLCQSLSVSERYNPASSIMNTRKEPMGPILVSFSTKSLGQATLVEKGGLFSSQSWATAQRGPILPVEASGLADTA